MLTLKNKISPDQFFVFFLLLFGPLAHGLVEIWSVTTAHLIVISLISIAVLVRVYKGKLTCYRTPVDIPILLFLLAILISYYTSVAPYASRIVIYKLLTAIALFFYIIHTQRNREKINLLLWVIVVLGTVYAVMGLTVVKGDFLGFKIFSRRHYNISLFYVNYNLFAGYLELVFLLSVGLAAAHRGGKQIFLFGMTVLTCLALLFTLSRGGILGASGGLAFFVIVSAFMQRRKKGFLIFTSAFFLGLIIIAWFGLDPVLDRLGTLENPSVAGETRIQIWQDTLRMIYVRPFTGWGPGTFSLAFPAYQAHGFKQQFVNYAHNDYLELAADTGMLGLVIFIIGIIILYISCLKKLKMVQSKYWQNVGLGALAACFSILIHSATDCNLQVSANLFLFVIAAGISVIAADKSRAKHHSLRADITLSSPGKKWCFFSGYFFVFCISTTLVSLPFWGERNLTAAKNFLRHRKYNDASAQVDRALLLNPDYAELLSLRGDILLTRKIQTDTLADIKNCTGCEKIIFWYEKASKAAQTDSTYFLKKAATFERYQKISTAENAYKKAILLSPMYAPHYYSIATLFIKQRKMDKAVNSFRQFLELSGTKKIPKVLDDIWSAGGDYKAQQQAIPKKASFRQAFAKYLTRDGEKELAEQEAAFAFALEPTARNARVHLIQLWRNKNFVGLLGVCKEYQQQFPEDQRILRRYAETFVKLKQYDEAISIYRRLIGMSSKSKKNVINYFVRIAGLYAQQKLYTDAVSVLHEGIAKFPRTGKLYQVLGIYFRRMKKNEEALHALKKAVSLKPDNAVFRYHLGVEYRRHKLEQEALKEWEACLTINSHFTRCEKGIDQLREKFGLSNSGQ